MLSFHNFIGLGLFEKPLDFIWWLFCCANKRLFVRQILDYYLKIN